nr:hypothetical protein [Tanacetum cinerariifolium]
MDQNIASFGFDPIQPSQYPLIHHPSQKMSEEVFQAKGNLMKSIQTFLEKFNCISFGEKLKEYLENSSNTIVASNFNQEKEKSPQDSDNYQLVREECGIKVCEKQNQNMEDTLLELIEVCRQKEFYCMYNDVDDLIESALNSKLLSINLRSQHLDKKKKEVKNIIEQPIKRRTQPEYSHSMGYEHLSTTLETESDEVNKSSVEKLIPIPKEYEDTLDNERECDVPVCEDSTTFDVLEDHSEILSDSNNDNISSDDDTFEDIDINRLIADIKSLNDNLTPDRVLKSFASFPIFEESDNSLSNNSLPKFKTISDHMVETRSGSTTTHANNSLPEYDSFCFEIESNQGRLTSVVKNNISDDSTYDPLLEESIYFLLQIIRYHRDFPHND